MAKPKGFTKIAEIGNDSGTMCIVDPCYLESDNTEWREGFMQELHDAVRRDSRPLREDIQGLAAVFSTGGDGCWPVWAKIKGGRITEIRIQFP